MNYSNYNEPINPIIKERILILIKHFTGPLTGLKLTKTWTELAKNLPHFPRSKRLQLSRQALYRQCMPEMHNAIIESLLKKSIYSEKEISEYKKYIVEIALNRYRKITKLQILQDFNFHRQRSTKKSLRALLSVPTPKNKKTTKPNVNEDLHEDLEEMNDLQESTTATTQPLPIDQEEPEMIPVKNEIDFDENCTDPASSSAMKQPIVVGVNSISNDEESVKVNSLSIQEQLLDAQRETLIEIRRLAEIVEEANRIKKCEMGLDPNLPVQFVDAIIMTSART